jgi:hypothetical protein
MLAKQKGGVRHMSNSILVDLRKHKPSISKYGEVSDSLRRMAGEARIGSAELADLVTSSCVLNDPIYVETEDGSVNAIFGCCRMNVWPLKIDVGCDPEYAGRNIDIIATNGKTAIVLASGTLRLVGSDARVMIEIPLPESEKGDLYAIIR